MLNKNADSRRRSSFYSTYVKRGLDLVLVIPLILALIPALLILTLLIRRKIGSPILFSQERAGKEGEPFILYKFRSMSDEKDETGRLLPDERRLLPFGKFLRETSLDELPELYNILLGKMSFIGPRPLPSFYLDRYSSEQARRHEVTPGLTGWAAVCGRNNQTWESIFNYDIWYVDHCSLLFDIKIFFKTIIVVLKREGIYRGSEGFAKEFQGTRDENTGASDAL